MNNFGDRLRILRTNAGMSQEELAAKSGMLRQNLSKIETGETRLPKPPSQARIAAAFGLSLDEFTERLEAIAVADSEPDWDDPVMRVVMSRVSKMTPEGRRHLAALMESLGLGDDDD